MNNPPGPQQNANPPLAGQITGNWAPSGSESSQQPSPKIRVHKDQLVWVHRRANGWSQISGPADNKGRTFLGFVPTHVVKEGVAKASPLPVELPKQKALSVPALLTSSSGGSSADDTVLKVLKLIWSSIRNNRDALFHQSDKGNAKVDAMLFGPDSENYPNILYRSMVRPAREIMRNGTFDPRDMIAAMPTINNKDHNGNSVYGVYIYYFHDVNHSSMNAFRSQARRDALYSGKSIDIPARLNQHNIGLANPSYDSKKYVVGRTGNPRKMTPLFLFRHGDHSLAQFDKSVLMNVAELTAVCLFRSWNPLLLTSSNVSTSEAAALNKDFHYARAFDSMMEQVKQQIPQWNPRPVIGLNWQTPAMSLDGSAIERQWVSWYSWERKCYIYRLRLRVFDNSTSGSYAIGVMWRTQQVKILFPKWLIDEAGLKRGDIVTLHVELSNDGTQYTEHPMPWIRVPQIAHNKEFEKLRSLSIQVQWLDSTTNKWKSAPIQWPRFRMRQKDDSEFNGFINGIQLLSTLTQTSYQNAPAWLKPLDSSVIRRLKYDHLKQRAWFSPQPNSLTLKPWPSNYTMQQNQERLRLAIPPNYRARVLFGARPADDAVPGHRRKGLSNMCDLCYSFHDGAGNAKCGPLSGNGSTCLNCSRLNRPCTWTFLAPNESMVDLIGPGKPLACLGIPVEMHKIEEKIAKKEKREPRSLVRIMAEAPYETGIENQIQNEADEADEAE